MEADSNREDEPNGQQGAENDGQGPVIVGAPLTDADLIPDQALTRAADDRFHHAPLARRVAELVASVEPPLNVALFGPWGSGKSSLAGLIRERLKGEDAGFVYYNAWKFGGRSLRRNFISNAAKELNLPRDDDRWEKYYGGLYQSKRRAKFHASDVRKAIKALTWAFLALLGILLVLLIGVLAIASTFTDRNVMGQIEHSLPDYLGPGGALALLVAVLTAAVSAGRVDIDQSAPSDDEEFSQRFRDLIGDVRSKENGNDDKEAVRRYGRIVFFIDELDRCDEKDVVQTLVAVRTFLDEDHCVFVVAADRDVLETALQREVDQATPTDTTNPYYTTAGAFLDKIFGHQIEVPPLRGRRLTRFARDLVRDRGGVWREIVEAGGRAELDSVIYALIPAHVRSPRRVKVLLNNFATNARVAEGRQIEWPGRAQEIAKLTALQTEFPALARDLVTEPRLPRFLLNLDDPAISERAQVLVERHRVDENAPESTEDPDPYLDGQSGEDGAGNDEGRQTDMRKQHPSQLLRYLERTDGVRNPQRDLLYLEAAGAAVDLADPELGELIEERAPEAPSEVVSEVEGRAEEEQVAVVRLLADMVQDTIADEQANVMTAMMELASALGPVLSDRAADDVAKSLRLFSRDKPLAPEHLVGALAVALRVDDEELTLAIASREELWDHPDRVSGVAVMMPVLPQGLKTRLFAQLRATLSSHPAVLVDPVAALEETQALELLKAPDVHDEAERFLADSTADADARTTLADGLLGAALDA